MTPERIEELKALCDSALSTIQPEPFWSPFKELIKAYELKCEQVKALQKAMGELEARINKKQCPCCGDILADKEDCKTPLCYNCYEELERVWLR